MNRRRQHARDNPERKPRDQAFSPKGLALLKEAVVKLFQNVASKDPVALSCSEFYDMFVPAEYRATFKVAHEVMEVWAMPNIMHKVWSVTSHACMLKFELEKGPVPKETVSLLVQEDFDPNKKKAFDKWVCRRAHLVKEFSLLWELITRLNYECCNPSEVRYFLPGLQVLQGGKPTSYVPIKNPPMLPPEVKNLCRRMATLIATTQLIGEKEEHTLPVEVTINEFTWHEEGYGSVKTIVG